VARTHQKAAGHSEGGPILDGDRNNHLTSLAGTMRRRGMSEAAIRAALMAENEERCVPPLSETEVAQIAKSAGRYAPGQDHQLPPVEVYVEDARKEGRGGNSDASHHDKHGEATTGSADTGGAPTIQYKAGELPRNLDEAESALLISGRRLSTGVSSGSRREDPGSACDSIGAPPWRGSNHHPAR
jgi:hypothetical protein